MKKEPIIAIVFGIILGITVGFFVLFQTNKKESGALVETQEVVQNEAKKITDTILQQDTLEISSPEDSVIAREDSVKIQGQAGVDSLIIVQSPSAQRILKTKEKSFTIDFPLATGENVIHVSAYLNDNLLQEKTLKVYYVTDETE